MSATKIGHWACFCVCHHELQDDDPRPMPYWSVKTDPIATVTACDRCQPDHFEAILKERQHGKAA